MQYIGGAFELDLKWFARERQTSLTNFFCNWDDAIKVSSGRAALDVLLMSVSRPGQVILLPDYMCFSTLMPTIEKAGLEVVFYPVDYDLHIDADELFSSCDTPPEYVLLIDYFGCVDHGNLAGNIRSSWPETKIILDNVQALYRLMLPKGDQSWADWKFYSFRKFLPVPDGGVLLGEGVCPPEGAVADADLDAILMFVIGAATRNDFIHNEGGLETPKMVEGFYLDALKSAAAGINLTPRIMSQLTLRLLERLPLQEFADHRRRNFLFLSSNISNTTNSLIQPLFNKLGITDIPMTFPIRVREGKRDLLLECMRDQSIFCPVHWPIEEHYEGNAGSSAKQLSSEIMSLPIDQRYGVEDMDRMLNVLFDCTHNI